MKNLIFIIYLWVVCLIAGAVPLAHADSVQTINLPANDLVYDAVTRKIYVSVPSNAPNNRGNTITVIDPFTGVIGPSVFIGSEPNVLALSDDGRYLYVGLDGAAAIRRFEIATLTAGLQFSLGDDPLFGTLYPREIKVQPGNADVIAVSRRHGHSSMGQAGVAIFENGVQRDNIIPWYEGANTIEWGATANRLYGLNSESSGFEFRRLDVTDAGVSEVDGKITAINTYYATIRFARGEIYASDGHVINAETRELIGSFPSIPAAQAVCPDVAKGRVAFLVGNRLVICDRATWRYVGEMVLPNGETGRSLVRWGDEGLAFVSGGKVQLARTSLLNVPLPRFKPLPINPEINGLRRVDLAASDLIYDAPRGEILAAVSDKQNGYENSLTPIKPLTGLAGGPVYIGAAPSKLAKADDGKTVWAGLLGEAALRPYDAETRRAGSRFSLRIESYPHGQLYHQDIAVQPGNANVVAVSLRGLDVSPSHAGVAIFDSGVQRPQTTPQHTGSNVIEWSERPETLYGLNTETTEYGFRRMQVSESGVAVVNTKSYNSGFYGDILYSNGRVYFTNGRVINPETGELLGTYGSGGQVVCVDEILGRVFFISSGVYGQDPPVLTAYDRDEFTLIGSRTLTGVAGDIKSLVRWGIDGLAFISYNNFSSDSNNKVWLLRTSLVDKAPRLALQIAPAEVEETAGVQAVTATLTRNSDFDVPLNVQLFANRPADVEIPSTITIPVGQASVTFFVDVKDNSIADGTRLALITGRASGWTQGTGRLTIFDDEAALALSITPQSFTENAGSQAAKATVTRNTPVDVPLRVLLSSSDRSEASVPGAIFIPTGARSITFFVAAVNDDEVDGPQTSIITAYTAGYSSAQQQLEVRDEDRPSLSLTLSKPAISESDGPYAVLLTVTRNASLAQSMTVTLQNNQPGRIKVPVSVTIPAGARRSSVWVAAIDDSVANGDQSATLRAIASLFAPAQAQLTIQDDD